jgi:glutamate-1-semialdehyde 2,1-aminomutase
LVAMKHYGLDTVRELNQLGELARDCVREAIRLSGRDACITGTGSMFRIHLRSEEPKSYRDAHLDPQSKKQVALLVEGMLDRGVMLTNTATAMLSTAMGKAEIGRMAEAVLDTLRGI